MIDSQSPEFYKSYKIIIIIIRSIKLDMTRCFHPFLSFIPFGNSSSLHPLSSIKCSMYIFGRPCVFFLQDGIQSRTSLVIPSLLRANSDHEILVSVMIFCWEACRHLLGELFRICLVLCEISYLSQIHIPFQSVREKYVTSRNQQFFSSNPWEGD